MRRAAVLVLLVLVSLCLLALSAWLIALSGEPAMAVAGAVLCPATIGLFFDVLEKVVLRRSK